MVNSGAFPLPLKFGLWEWKTNTILHPFFQSEALWALCASSIDRHIYGNSWVAM